MRLLAETDRPLETLRFHSRLPLTGLGLHAARGEVAAIATELGFVERRVRILRVAVHEAVSQMLASGSECEPGAQLRLEVWRGPRLLTVCLAGPTGCGPVDLSAQSTGLDVLSSLCDWLEVGADRDHSELRLYFRLPSAAAAVA